MMKRLFTIPLVAMLAVVLMSGPAMAQPQNNDSRSTYSAPANSGNYVVNTDTSKTPWYKSRTMKNVGIGAGGGAVFGALTGGRKGAAIGALIGGGGGYVYNRVTKDKNKR